MSNSVTSKFKKGDLVKVVKIPRNLSIEDVSVGAVGTIIFNDGSEIPYAVESAHFEYEDSLWFTEECLELLSEPKSYRNMKPTDLITISIDGNESEVPLGDLVHATMLLGVTNGFYGGRLWKALNESLGKDSFTEDMETVIEFRDKQKETLDYFFKPYYDKQQQEKEDLSNLISKKQNELEQLVEKLNQM